MGSFAKRSEFMTRASAAVLGLLITGSQIGCATIFSGRTQKISIETTPPQATVVVVGGTAGTAILRAKDLSDVAKTTLALLEGHVSKKTFNSLELLDSEELITKLVVWLKFDEAPGEADRESSQVFAKIPQTVRDKILSVAGLEEVSVTPTEIELKRGRSYAVVASKSGYQSTISEVKSQFNWITALNVFNLFLGVPVDMITGAWRDLEPEHLLTTLPKRPLEKEDSA